MAITATSGPHRLYGKKSFNLVATTANQVIESIDLSSYGGIANHDATGVMRYLVYNVRSTHSVCPVATGTVLLKRSGTSNWSGLTPNPIISASDLDFVYSTNTLQVRVDGGASATVMVIEWELSITVASTV